jgi:hypothetical protein
MKTYQGTLVPGVDKCKLTNRVHIDSRMKKSSTIDLERYVEKNMIRELAEAISRHRKLERVNLTEQLREKYRHEPLDKYEQMMLDDYYRTGKEVHEASAYVFTEKELKELLSNFEAMVLEQSRPPQFKREILGTFSGFKLSEEDEAPKSVNEVRRELKLKPIDEAWSDDEDKD